MEGGEEMTESGRVDDGEHGGTEGSNVLTYVTPCRMFCLTAPLTGLES